MIPNTEGARTTPSVVAFTAKGERLVGQVAKRQAATNPEHTIYAVKRLMGQRFDTPITQKHRTSVPYSVVEHENGDAWVGARDKSLSPPEISSHILITMKQIADTYLGSQVTEAVITVPAYFDDAQRQATKDAGRIAGLDVKRILNEPTAAALAYGLDKKEHELIAVYDLGGGTFDISILELQGGVFSVKATGGDTHLGGEDFDSLIIDKLADEFAAANGLDLRKDRMSLQRLKEAAEKAKHELSSSIETTINVPFIASGPSGPLHLERTLKRSELEILTGTLVDRTITACKAVLADAKLTPKQIGQVVLVGGMTRMPAVQKAVREFFEREPHKGVNPDEVVAVGAAIQGAALGRGNRRGAAARRDAAFDRRRNGGRRVHAPDPEEYDGSDRAQRGVHDERRQPVVRAGARAPGRARNGGRQSQPRALRAHRHSAGAARHSEDSGDAFASTRTASSRSRRRTSERAARKT